MRRRGHIVGVDWSHPDNAGLALLLLGLPGRVGSTWADLTGKTSGATVETGAEWGWAGVVAAGGKGVAGVPIPYAGWVSGVTYGRSYWLAFTLRVHAFTGVALPLLDDAGRVFSSFYNASGAPSYEFSGWGTLVAGRRYRLVRYMLANNLSASSYVGVNGVQSATGSNAVWGTGGVALSFGGNPSSGSTANASTRVDYGDIQFGLGRIDAGWIARDYDWSRDPARDPRLRRVTGASYFVAPAAPGGGSAFVPALAAGWGWA